MNKTLSLILSIVGILLLIAAAKLSILYGSSTAFLALVLAVIGGIVFAIAWISALIRTARSSRWGWLVLLLLFSVVSLLIYLLWGPTPENVASIEIAEK